MLEKIWLRNWAFTAVTGIKKREISSIGSKRIMAILKNGRYVNPRTGATTTFTLPASLRESFGIESDIDEREDFEAGAGE